MQTRDLYGLHRFVIQLCLGAICISFAPIFVKAIHLGPSLIGVYRCLFAGLILVAIGGRRIPLNRDFLFIALLGGFFFAADLFVWHRSIHFVGAGLATILGNTQAFYLALAGILVLGDRVSLKVLLAIGIAFFGVWLLIVGKNPTVSSTEFDWGIAFGLMTGICYAGYILCLKRLEQMALETPSSTKLGVLCLISALILTLTSIPTHELAWPSITDFVYLMLLAVVAQVGGWMLITTSLPKVPVSKTGLALLVQPLGATLMGRAIYGESLEASQWLGGLLVLVGIYLGNTREFRDRSARERRRIESSPQRLPI